MWKTRKYLFWIYVTALVVTLALSCADGGESIAASGPAPVRSWRSGEYGGMNVYTFTDQWGRNCTGVWTGNGSGGMALHCNAMEEF
jgi:hypothetical protein